MIRTWRGIRTFSSLSKIYWVCRSKGSVCVCVYVCMHLRPLIYRGCPLMAFSSLVLWLSMLRCNVLWSKPSCLLPLGNNQHLIRTTLYIHYCFGCFILFLPWSTRLLSVHTFLSLFCLILQLINESHRRHTHTRGAA